RGGHAVRLERGDYGHETVYDADPADAARRWVEQGARALHVVDLDGARSGRPENLDHVRRIAAEAAVPVQLGGGLRDGDGVAAADAGAELVYSGGVGSLDDLAEIVSLGLESLGGVIVGRALYEGRFTVAEGQAALGG